LYRIKFQHEIATAFNLKGRGLVVLTSCSHRGVVNAIKEAQAASGVEKIHAVIGGFHLAPYQEEYVRDTVKALQEIDLTYLVPLHCTGEPFYDIARTAMPTKLLRSYTGTRWFSRRERSLVNLRSWHFCEVPIDSKIVCLSG
jgi:7,8-dihydropterin-6-yl-methyl-4-(beta-D-ribofuranosyl)aminobenzene 5'-phosphate synthase